MDLKTKVPSSSGDLSFMLTTVVVQTKARDGLKSNARRGTGEILIYDFNQVGVRTGIMQLSITSHWICTWVVYILRTSGR